jgi:hypothetical protein
MQRLLYLEKQGKWIDDVTQLKKIVAQQYYKTFHIIYISSLDSQVSTAKMQYAFTSNESTLLGKPLRLLYNQ